MAERKIRVEMTSNDSDSAYIALPGYPEQLVPGVVAKTLELGDLIEKYVGPRINLDFNKDGTLIGIEILA